MNPVPADEGGHMWNLFRNHGVCSEEVRAAAEA